MDKTEHHYIARCCPICGTPSNTQPAMHSDERAENMSYEDLARCWNGFFKKRVFFSYGRCRTCGILYAPTFFSAEQLKNLYAQMPANMDIVPLDALRRTQKGYYDFFKKYMKPDNDYIEIGPDIGLFTENCIRDGAFNKYWMFEPNRAVWPTLEKCLKNTPHEIVSDMFGFDCVPAKSTSAVVMIQVLDHLLDPLTTLKAIYEKLVPGATMVIVTHDESSWLRRLIGRRWPAFCLQHPQIYNPATISSLAKAAGFETVKIHKTVNYFPLQFLLKHALWAANIRVRTVPSFWNIVLGLKLGNMLAIVRKT